MFSHKSEVTNVQNMEIKKSYSVKGKDILVRIQNGKTGIVDGEKVVLDEVVIDNMANGVIQAIKNSGTKYNPLPDEIILRNGTYWRREEKDGESDKSQGKESTESEIIESYEPRFALADVALNEKVREQIKTAIAAVRYKKKMSEEWGMSEYFTENRAVILNFYGKSGTGKSMTAEAIAKELGKKVYHINYSELESKYVGETPKNIRKAFANAARDDAVLIFDEADSFLGKRLTSVTQSADYGVNITRSVLLMELEKYSGVVVFTTNLISNYDDAFKRRILLSVYFELPDEQAREKIWKLHIGKNMPLAEGVNAESLAKRYDNISGADIKDMVFYAALHALEQEKAELDFDTFDYANKAIKERYQNRDRQPQFEVVSTKTITEEQYKKETGGDTE